VAVGSFGIGSTLAEIVLRELFPAWAVVSGIPSPRPFPSALSQGHDYARGNRNFSRDVRSRVSPGTPSAISFDRTPGIYSAILLAIPDGAVQPPDLCHVPSAEVDPIR